MTALGIVFHLYDRTAVIHYQSCRWYQQALHKHLPLTRKVKIRFCRCCRPTPEDVAAAPPEVRWFEWSPGVLVKRTALSLDYAEKIAARQSLGIRKRNTGQRLEDFDA